METKWYDECFTDILCIGFAILITIIIVTTELLGCGGRNEGKSCPLPAATAPVEFEEVAVPPLDRDRTVTWFLEGDHDWTLPGIDPRETGCGIATTWRGGETISIPKGTEMQASFSRDEREAMKKLGFAPTCLYWHHPSGGDIYVEPRQLDDGTWVCWDKTLPDGGRRPEPVK